eukprot:339825-Pelagomonas_calceolata.AAC.2
MLRVRQYLCINNSALEITFQGATYLLSSILPVLNALSDPVQPTLKNLACHCTYLLTELSITSFSSLLNDNLTHVIDGNKLTSLLGHKFRTRHMFALNKLSHTLNSHNLTPDLIKTIIQSQDGLPNKPPESRRINNTMCAEVTKVEHTPACWNWSKFQVEHAPTPPP